MINKILNRQLLILPVIGLIIFFSCNITLCTAQTIQDPRKEYNESHYTRHEVMIPMRDGVQLFTVVYQPSDKDRRWPILLRRTPYGAARDTRSTGVPASLGPGESHVFARDGFIFVDQDVRGRFRSEGTFEEMRPVQPDPLPNGVTDESTDAYDTMEWLIKNVEGHNGDVGVYGLSYMGFYAACALIRPHPALKAAIVQAPVADMANGDDFRRNGAFYLCHAFSWMNRAMRRQVTPTNSWAQSFNPGTRDGYSWYLGMKTLRKMGEEGKMDKTFSWHALMEHPDYDDYWKERALTPHIKPVDIPVLMIGGWFDSEDFAGTLAVFNALNAGRDSKVSIVIGPWTHAGCLGGPDVGDSLGGIMFGKNLVENLQSKIEFPFLKQHLKSEGEIQLPKAHVFEVGTNQWRDLPDWPPKQKSIRHLYFTTNGGLSMNPPLQQNAFDTYVSDPAHPVPYLNRVVDLHYASTYPVADQRFEARRPDVLVFRGEPLQEDLTLAGPIEADIWVSTTGTDSDWVVKLIDVWPDDSPDPNPNSWGITASGYQQLVRGEILRGKYRNGIEKPVAMTPNQSTRIVFQLPDVLHTFRKGHRIMVHFQSSWFPLFDRNPQVFMDISKAKDADFRTATQRLYRDSRRPSHLSLPVVQLN